MRFVVPAWSLLDGKDYIIKQDLKDIEALQPDKKIQAEKNKIISESLTALLSSSLSAETKEILLIDIHGIEPDKANTLAYGEIEQGSNQETQEDTTEESKQQQNNSKG